MTPSGRLHRTEKMLMNLLAAWELCEAYLRADAEAEDGFSDTPVKTVYCQMIDAVNRAKSLLARRRKRHDTKR
jgi:hypothetical protein